MNQTQSTPPAHIAPGITTHAITVPHVLEAVALVYGLQVYVLTQAGRAGGVPRAKHIAAYLMAKHLKMSSVAIGKELRQDHSTVLHGAKVLQGLMESEELFARHVELVEKVLLGETVGDILNRNAKGDEVDKS